MNFLISVDNLLPALQSVIGVVEKGQTMPILSNVLVNISNGIFKITGTDLEVEITTFFPIEDTAIVLDFTVSAKKLFDICRNLSSGIDINFELKDKKLILKAKKSRFILAILSAENFPNLDLKSCPSMISPCKTAQNPKIFALRAHFFPPGF